MSKDQGKSPSTELFSFSSISCSGSIPLRHTCKLKMFLFNPFVAELFHILIPLVMITQVFILFLQHQKPLFLKNLAKISALKRLKIHIFFFYIKCKDILLECKTTQWHTHKSGTLTKFFCEREFWDKIYQTAFWKSCSQQFPWVISFLINVKHALSTYQYAYMHI